MNTTSAHAVTVEMLLWQADVQEKNGKRQEAAKIREWVADFLSEQSKIVRSVWRRLSARKTQCGRSLEMPMTLGRGNGFRRGFVLPHPAGGPGTFPPGVH